MGSIGGEAETALGAFAETLDEGVAAAVEVVAVGGVGIVQLRPPGAMVVVDCAAFVGVGLLGATVTPAQAAPGQTAIVIGTGFGGAVAARRLGEAGYTTTVFERRRRWPIRPDGNTFATTTNPDQRAAWFGSPAGASAASGIPVEPYPGVLDHVMGNGVEAVYGAGVGGGSLVFGSFTPVPRRQDFEHIFPAAADYAQLAQTYFPRAKAGLGVSPLRAARAPTPAAERMRVRRETAGPGLSSFTREP